MSMFSSLKVVLTEFDCIDQIGVATSLMITESMNTVNIHRIQFECFKLLVPQEHLFNCEPPMR